MGERRRNLDLEGDGQAAWSEGALHTTLVEGGVAVLRWSLDEPAADAVSLLTDAERARAKRFRFVRDGDRFVMARAGLRAVLAGWVGIRPQEVRFAYGSAGKPRLIDNGRPAPHRFNLTHSGGLAALALAWDQEVGVDVERVPVDSEPPLSLAKKCFVGHEIDSLRGGGEHELKPMFYRLWTQKEAVIKLTGEGLSADLLRFETPAANPVEGGGEGWVALPPGNPLGVDRCWLEPVEVAPGYVASIALPQRPRRVASHWLFAG